MVQRLQGLRLHTRSCLCLPSFPCHDEDYKMAKMQAPREWSFEKNCWHCWSSTAGASVWNLRGRWNLPGAFEGVSLTFAWWWAENGTWKIFQRHSWMIGLVVHDWIITFPTQGYSHSDETILLKEYGLFHALVRWDALGSFVHNS